MNNMDAYDFLTLARGIVVYGMTIMKKVFEIVQGIIAKIISTVSVGNATTTMISEEVIMAVENCGFLESISI